VTTGEHHAAFFASDYIKVLVRDNPRLGPAEREAQARRVAQVSAWAVAKDRPFIVELLVPPTDADKAATGGDTGRYDDELRPGHTLSAMGYLQDHGVEPAIWKVEGLDRHHDAVAVAQMATRAGRSARCIVLGRHADHQKLDHWLRVAAPVPGYIGFAIGRSIWWDALHAHLHHYSTAQGARDRIAGAYVEFANYYIKAREGLLIADVDPEFR
jgi:5-dehydro-2-deoxygluconokinase